MKNATTLSVKEVDNLLGVSRTKGYEWRKAVGLKAIPGSSPNRPRYLRADVERAMGANDGGGEGGDAPVPAWAIEGGEVSGRRLRPAFEQTVGDFGRGIVEALQKAGVFDKSK